MTGNLTTRFGARRRRLRRLVVLASTSALIAALFTSGTAQASFALGGTWGAYDEDGNELNVAVRDIFGTDGSTVYTGSEGSKSHSWVDGLDGVADDGPLPNEYFVNGDITCVPEAPLWYYSQPDFTCWDRAFSSATSTPGPWGEAFPIVAKGIDDSDLVFDHWEVTGSPDAGDGCFTGEIGIPQFDGGLLVPGPGGEADLVPAVGYKSFIDLSAIPPTGFDFTAKAIYAPLTPDTSAPVVTIVKPLECRVIEAGGSLITSFNCVDPGDSDPNPSCVGDVANGTSVDTSTIGEHEFSVTGTDAYGNARIRTIRYSVVPDTTPPETALDSSPPNPSTTGTANFDFSGTDGVGVQAFECRLDDGAFATCTSPTSYNDLVDGGHTVDVRAIDGAGNGDPTPASFSWRIDTAPPDTTILSNPSDPAVSAYSPFTFVGLDAGTGVSGYECSLDDASFEPCNETLDWDGAHFKVYPAVADGSHTFTVRAIDGLGSVDPTPAAFTWQVDTSSPGDTTDPEITISAPTATTYLLNQSINASYTCTDAGGPPTCAGPVANGAEIDTASVGSKSFTVNAEDNAGNIASATVAYSVQAGFVGFQQPVDNAALNVANAGKSIPLKWRIVDANGAPVTTWPTVTVTATSLSCNLGSTPDLIEEYAAGASGLQNLGNGYYQFNWATPKSYANSCKTLHLSLGDGADHTAQFQFKK